MIFANCGKRACNLILFPEGGDGATQCCDAGSRSQERLKAES